MLEIFLTAIKSRRGLVSTTEKANEGGGLEYCQYVEQGPADERTGYLAMLSRGVHRRNPRFKKFHPRTKDWAWALFSILLLR